METESASRWDHESSPAAKRPRCDLRVSGFNSSWLNAFTWCYWQRPAKVCCAVIAGSTVVTQINFLLGKLFEAALD